MVIFSFESRRCPPGWDLGNQPVERRYFPVHQNLLEVWKFPLPNEHRMILPSTVES